MAISSTRKIWAASLIVPAACMMFGQSPGSAPSFEVADVHISPKASNQFMRATPLRNGRYEIHSATMVDLIRVAYGFDPDKILGGPSWLEMNRFDVIAKAPPDTTTDALKPMLQSLLADRFRLVIHNDTRPLPTYALTVGRKPQLKEADGTGDTGCKPQTSNAPPAEGGIRLVMNGTPIALGPGMSIQYQCRNMTMEAFASGLRNMLGAAVGPNAVLDQTGLKGTWNFDVHWSVQMFGGPANQDGADRISVFDAVEKQLGLKLEQKQIPTPVILVERVNEKPTDNPPGVAEALPVIPVPTEFEVADIKPTDPDFKGGRMQVQPGGRFTAQGMPIQFLLSRAFNTFNSDEIVGIPKWADSARFDITAKAATNDGAALDMNSAAPMLLALFEERFKLKFHKEERSLPAYTLVAAKPKLKKADPTQRTNCKNGNGPQGAPAGTAVLTCQNVTMAQFADQLQGKGPGMNWPVLDATGIEGTWDISLTYNRNAGIPMMAVNGGGRGGEGGPSTGDTASASDPSGGLTIFEAVDKQLGLRLEIQKRQLPVTVIDHLEEKPTDN